MRIRRLAKLLLAIAIVVGCAAASQRASAQVELAEEPATDQQQLSPRASEPSEERTEKQHESPPTFDEIGRAVREMFERISPPRSRYKSGPRVREAFRPVVSEARLATVQVRVDGRRVAYGGIVGPDGWVLTKASLARGRLTCRLSDGRELPARVVGVDRANDLAMLKIAATDLPSLDLTGRLSAGGEVSLRKDQEDTDPETAPVPSSEQPPAPAPRDGDWVATVGAGRDPEAVGVVSVGVRKIEKRRGLLGISMDVEFKGNGARVEYVREGGAAEKAGVAVGDVITAVNGLVVGSPEALKRVIGGDNSPGDVVLIKLLREGQELLLRATLTSWDPNPAERRAYYQNNLGGKLSERRFGFEQAFQHDTILEPRDCGGPLVDLDGRVVGFNISRAGRTESYALPVALVREKLYALMSGKLAPSGEEARPGDRSVNSDPPTD